MSSEPKNISSPDTPILIVDDNPQYILVLKKILESVFGYKNITTVDGIDRAMTEISSNPDRFRLLFVDYYFPSGKTGGELLMKLQEKQLLDGKVAFLITSEPSLDNMKHAMSAGAMGLVAKPFDREQLKKQLEKAARSILTDQMESF